MIEIKSNLDYSIQTIDSIEHSYISAFSFVIIGVFIASIVLSRFIGMIPALLICIVCVVLLLSKYIHSIREIQSQIITKLVITKDEKKFLRRDGVETTWLLKDGYETKFNQSKSIETVHTGHFYGGQMKLCISVLVIKHSFGSIFIKSKNSIASSKLEELSKTI
jgi:hypothetical protein